SIHLLIQNQNAAFVLGHYISMVLKVLSIAILGAIGLWVVFTILLAVLVFSPKQSAVLNTQTNYVEVEAPVAFETIPENQNLNVANLEEYRDRKKVVNQTQELADSDNVEHGQIYDAIPINRLS
ncbi:MAG: hypothetical protein H3C43_14350, partial [Leptonema sp. (in: Bacteria)]|nr:hypothetical protein [Leptonema sp. (in: bacteria)]